MSGGKDLRCDSSFRRKAYGDGGALAFCAVNVKRAAVQFDKAMGQGQANASALLLLAQSVVHLTEPRHRLDEVLLIHVDAGVRYRGCVRQSAQASFLVTCEDVFFHAALHQSHPPAPQGPRFGGFPMHVRAPVGYGNASVDEHRMGQ